MRNGKTRSFLMLSIASGIYMVSGYFLNLWLARYLGPSTYGDYGFVITFMTLINLAQTSGLPQALSKKVAEEYADVGLIVRAAFLLQILSALLLSGLIVALAYPVTQAIHDKHLGSVVMLSAVILPTYGLYSLLLGYYNGIHAFSRQSALNIVYSLAKLSGVILLTLQFGLVGAISGFALAPLIALITNPTHIPKPRTKNYRATSKELLRISMPLISFAVTTTAMLSIDLFIVKKDFPGSAYAGYYVAAQNIALVPYLGLSAFSQMILPIVSRAISSGNTELAKDSLAKSLRTLTFLLVPTVVCLSVASRIIVKILFSSRYDLSARPLEILAFSYGTLAVFQLIANALNGAGHYKDSVRSSLIGLVSMTTACTLLTPKFGLAGAAFGSLIGSSVATLCILIITRRKLLPRLNLRVVSTLFGMGIGLYLGTGYLARFGYLAQALLYIELLLIYIYFGTHIPDKIVALNRKQGTKQGTFDESIASSKIVRFRRAIVPLAVPLILLGYLVFRNTIPFTFTKAYATAPGATTIKLVPSSRVIANQGLFTQYQSPIYFSTKTSIAYDNVKASLKFKQSSSNQEVLIGYRDQATWHYNTQV